MGLVLATFGDCRIDGKSRLLRRKGKDVHLTPKAYELLELLLERRPAVVDKQAIMNRLWPNTFVSDANVSNLIADIREAIGDTHEDPRFIRTVHRVGYAFCAQIGVAREESHGQETPNLYSLIVGGREVPLAGGDNIVGRGKACQIRVSSETVSRRHACISIKEGGATISDLGSKNGTFVCGMRLCKPARLCNGDEIQVGSVRLQFRALECEHETKTYASRRRKGSTLKRDRRFKSDRDGTTEAFEVVPRRIRGAH
jgi:DNA-binding winged helix-turn-helix (wHTH) protein